MFATIAASVRDLPRALTLPALLSGLLVIVIGSASSLVIVLQAANAGRLDASQISSWVLAIMLGCAASSLIMSLWFRQPVIAAWSTPGAVLLANSLGDYAYAEAIGAYLLAAAAITIIGISGLFGWLMARVPAPVVLGMLAGILIRFGVGMFNAIPASPVLVLAMIAIYFVLRRYEFRAPTVAALAVGTAIALISGGVQAESIALALATPVWTPPVFTPQAALGLALPLAVLALTSQNAPGQAVLKAAGYALPINGALLVTGLASLIGAPFGGHGVTLAAITAALVTGAEAHPDHDLRYGAGVATALWYTVVGVFGATLVSLFTALPAPLIATVAGLGLVGAIGSSLSGAMSDPYSREAGLIALLCTAADFRLLEIGAPFWGLVFGVTVSWLLRRRTQ